MTCPPEIAEVLVEIIHLGILSARTRGWAGDSLGCATEADHIHNLPQMLNDYSLELLKYYWEVERPSFINRNTKANLREFEALWERLEAVLRLKRTAP